MTVSLKHIFQSAKPDSADETLIQPSNWNEEHELTAAAGKVLGRDTSGNGAVQELPISVSPAGNVTIPNNFAVTGTVGVTGTTTLVNLTSTGTATLTNLGVTGTTTLTNALTVPNGGTGVTTLTANNVLIGNGTSAVQTVAPGSSGNVLVSNGTSWVSGIAPANPSLEAIASGTLADGSTVIVNADGTVSAVAGVLQVVGSATVFESANTGRTVAVYDANAQKVVIAYADNGNSSYGTAVVGTVSGTSISFGTPVVFASVTTSSSQMAAAYDAAQQKVTIGYRDETGALRYGYAVVGTVSGTSISFGTPVLFSAGETLGMSATYEPVAQKVVFAYRGTTDYGRSRVGTISGTSISFGTEVVFESAPIADPSITYDANAQKVVIAYTDSGNSGFGTAIVGTVSGTSISFGTAVVFESASTAGSIITYDANAQKVVIAYTDSGNSGFGTAIVGTVSGTSISFGTEVVFESANSSAIAAAYDANAQKVVIAYRDIGNSGFGTAIVGTVSGTSISFGTAVVFESASTTYIFAAYDANAQKVVIAYTDAGNSSFGTAVVFQVGSTNLTSENFIGFSNAAYTNGQTATIQIVGAVDDAQSGLTPGQQYFVQTTGSLGLTASEPSVFAGTAVAATKIIVKG